MAAIILDYFGDWKTHPLTCPRCGWTGTFQQGDTELFDSLQDCHCPMAHTSAERPMLAIVPHPTLEDYRNHWDQLPERERRYIQCIETSRDRFNRLKLRTIDPLPDLPESVLDLAWDQEGEDLVIRLGDREIWREPVRYEALWRYKEILALLQEKYGARMRDLEPTKASWNHLYGDKTGHAHVIERIRKGLRTAWEGCRQSG